MLPRYNIEHFFDSTFFAKQIQKTTKLSTFNFDLLNNSDSEPQKSVTFAQQ